MNGLGCIDYQECGDGPAVVLVPGSCSTGAAWRPVVAQLENEFRCVTTSLLGYGGTAERRTLRDADISHEAEMLESVVRRVGRPVHLVGHSFGGLVALAVALRNQVPLLSLAILEAPAPGVLRSMGEHHHYRAFREMTDSYFGAFLAGDAMAIAAMIDFYGGAGTFIGWPQRVRDYAVDTTAVNILDWAGAYGFEPAADLLATVGVPVTLIWGGESHRAVRRANELLGNCMRNVSVVTIAGAAHFFIATHAHKAASLIAQHVGRAECAAECGASEQPPAARRHRHVRADAGASRVWPSLRPKAGSAAMAYSQSVQPNLPAPEPDDWDASATMTVRGTAMASKPSSNRIRIGTP
jgi:pimeloyl-ACP methyl ester carboxylesterase